MKVTDRRRVVLTDAVNEFDGQDQQRGSHTARSTGRGGASNPRSGFGGAADKADGTEWSPTSITRETADTIYVESWAAAKFVDIPVDDMFLRGRQFVGEENQIEKMEDALAEFEVRDRLCRAMKAGRLYGSALLVIVTKGQSTEAPLDPEKLGANSLANLLIFDRWDATIYEWDLELESTNYGRPLIYEISPRLTDGTFGDFRVHYSRVIRFDGRRPLCTEGWSSYYERDWGVSELIPLLGELAHDEQIAAAIAHLVTEASIPVVKASGMRDAITGKPSPDDPTVEQLGQTININKSIYRTFFIDTQDEFERVNVTFHGLPDLMDRFALRIAAIAGIPATRFLSRSPVGMNATGESDAANYAMHVGTMQERLLTDPMTLIDMVLVRHLGIGEPMRYRWLPLVDQSDEQQAAAAKMKAEALAVVYDRGAITEREMREQLADEELFSGLDEMPEEGLPGEMQREDEHLAAEAELKSAMAGSMAEEKVPPKKKPEPATNESKRIQ